MLPGESTAKAMELVKRTASVNTIVSLSDSPLVKTRLLVPSVMVTLLMVRP